MQCIKTQVLGYICSIKHAFWPFLDYGFNAASKTGNLGINATFINQILINFIDFKYISQICIEFIKISILNAVSKPKLPVLDASVKPKSVLNACTYS